MNQFRVRLLFAFSFSIVMVFVALGLLLGQLFKTNYVDSYNARLQVESALISEVIQQEGGLNEMSRQNLQRFSEKLDARLTVANRQGKIFFDNGSLTELNNERHQAMIVDVLNSYKAGKDAGISSIKGGYDVYYYWNGIGEDEGVVVVSTRIEELQEIYRNIWWVISISLATALALIMYLSSRITTRYTKPIDSAARVAIELAKGNYSARTYETFQENDATSMLNTSINILARNLQDMVSSKETEHQRLMTLIENMGNGLVLMDHRGYIQLMNKPFKESMHLHTDQTLYRLYYDAIPMKEIQKIIEEIFLLEERIRTQVTLEIGIERRHFDVYGAPILGHKDEWRGVVLVLHDISDLKRLEQIRKDFVANVSHELRTPITSIKGFAETLLDGAKNDEQTLEHFLSIILKESDRLQTLIQELLELSKIEKYGFTLQLGEVSINELVKDVVHIVQPRAQQKSISLEISKLNRTYTVIGDRNRLQQVLVNLVSNAITYTSENGSVTVSVEEQEEEVLIYVTDTGMGIPIEQIPRIFERFYRVDRARSRHSGGTGLGLAIVKHIIDAHNGFIDVFSKVDEGSTFVISLKKNGPEEKETYPS